MFCFHVALRPTAGLGGVVRTGRKCPVAYSRRWGVIWQGLSTGQVRQILGGTLFFGDFHSGIGDDIHRKEVTVAGFRVELDCLAGDGGCG